MKQILILRGQVKVEKEIVKERQNPLMCSTGSTLSVVNRPSAWIRW